MPDRDITQIAETIAALNAREKEDLQFLLAEMGCMTLAPGQYDQPAGPAGFWGSITVSSCDGRDGPGSNSHIDVLGPEEDIVQWRLTGAVNYQGNVDEVFAELSLRVKDELNKRLAAVRRAMGAKG